MKKLAMILSMVMILSVFGGVPMQTVKAEGEETTETREPKYLVFESGLNEQTLDMKKTDTISLPKLYLLYEKETTPSEPENPDTPTDPENPGDSTDDNNATAQGESGGQTGSGEGTDPVNPTDPENPEEEEKEYDKVEVTDGLEYSLFPADSEVISITDGIITAKATGSVVIKYFYKVNEEKTLTASYTVNVTNPIVKLSIVPDAVEMVIGTKQILKAEYTYYDKSAGPADDVTFVSSNAQNVSVSPETGEIEALKVSTDTVITAWTPDQTMFATCKVTVTGIKVEGITLNATELNTLTIGDTFQLVSMLTPADATNQEVTYAVVETEPLKSSVSTSVVSVGKTTGLVTIKGLGKAVVEATTSDGSLKARCTFNVYQNYFDVTKLGANGTDEKKDTTYINKALKWAIAIDEQATVYVPAGTYYIGDRLYIYSNTRLVLDPNATIIRVASAAGRPMLQSKYSGSATSSTKGYTQCENIEITGGTWDGNPSGKDYTNNFYIGHAQNVYIHDTTVKNNSGSHLIEFAGVNNGTIERVNLDGFKVCTRSGYGLSGQVVKEAIQLDYCSKASASVFTPHDNTVCQNITIQNCNISNYMCGIGAHGCKPGVYLKNIYIANNTFTNITNCCIDLRNFRDVTVVNNTASGYHTFLYGYNSTGTIENNNLTNRSFTPITKSYRMYGNGIYLSTKSEFTINGNTISGCSNHGISIASGSKVTITNNKVKKNTKYGIKVENATATIKGNSVSSNKYTRQYYSDAKAKITADNIQAYYVPLDAEYKYTGKAIKPSIKIAGLKKGKTFTVSYKKNKKVGTAQVTIKGKGKVKGKLVLTFNIVKKLKKKK